MNQTEGRALISMEGDTLMKLRSGFILLIGGLLLAGSAAAAAGKLLGLKTSVDPQGTTILLRMPAPVEFTPSQVGPRLYLVDVAGVLSDQTADTQPIQSPLVSSYRVFSYHGADDRPHVGVELTLKEAAEVRSTAVAEGLQIRVERVATNRAPAPAAPAPTTTAAVLPKPVPATRTTLREVSVVQPEGSSDLEVEIIADSEITYQTFKLRNPDRLVVDLPNTLNRIKQRRLDVNASPLKAIRIGQFRNDPPISRVVMDLDSQVPYQIQDRANGLVIALSSSSSTAASSKKMETAAMVAAVAPVVAPADAPIAAIEPASVTELQLEPAIEPAASAEPVLLASNDPIGIVAPEGTPGQPIWAGEAASFKAMAPAAKLTEVHALPQAKPVIETNKTVFQEMISPAASIAAGIPAKAEPVLHPETVAEASSSSTPVVLMAQQLMPAASSAPMQTFTGEPISLNLKDVDLKDFFRLMHEVSGLNVVLDPNVAGVVTIVLDEVPWDQAMDVVLKNNGLEARAQGNVVRIARVSTLETEAKAQLAKAQAEQQRDELAIPTQTEPVTLGYAKAAALVTPLKRFLSPRGDIVPDPRTNTLIITDVPANIAKIRGLLSNLDRKTPQVEIEARIVAATRSFARDIGSQLAASGASGNVILGGAGIVGTSPITRGTVPPLFIGQPPEAGSVEFANVSQPLAVNFGAVGPTSGLSLILTGGNRFALDAIITAAESKGLGKLLSRPKIITQNNIEGTVQQGVRIPIQTSVNNTVTTQYISVVLRLTVTPQITSDGTIFLTTDIENTTINPGIPRILGQPALNTQSATTQVLVSDGGTVFFGGIIQTDNNLTETEVPLLGSIPLVGHLFRRKATSTTTQELLFFVTPKITQS